MFKIHRTSRGDRLEANAVLTSTDFHSIAKTLGQASLRIPCATARVT
jgi:hypothetical protein